MTTYHGTALSRLFEHRYKFDVGVYNLRTKEFRETTVFLDTGCYNTLIPRDLAEQSGRPLGFKMKYSLGANLIETEACYPATPDSLGVLPKAKLHIY